MTDGRHNLSVACFRTTIFGRLSRMPAFAALLVFCLLFAPGAFTDNHAVASGDRLAADPAHGSDCPETDPHNANPAGYHCGEQASTLAPQQKPPASHDPRDRSERARFGDDPGRDGPIFGIFKPPRRV